MIRRRSLINSCVSHRSSFVARYWLVTDIDIRDRFAPRTRFSFFFYKSPRSWTLTFVAIYGKVMGNTIVSYYREMHLLSHRVLYHPTWLFGKYSIITIVDCPENVFRAFWNAEMEFERNLILVFFVRDCVYIYTYRFLLQKIW